jgi:hypothetical protein
MGLSRRSGPAIEVGDEKISCGAGILVALTCATAAQAATFKSLKGLHRRRPRRQSEQRSGRLNRRFEQRQSMPRENGTSARRCAAFPIAARCKRQQRDRRQAGSRQIRVPLVLPWADELRIHGCRRDGPDHLRGRTAKIFRFHLDPNSRQITFKSGPFAGKPAKLADGLRIDFSATSCSLER